MKPSRTLHRTQENIERLKEFLNAGRYSMSDFWLATKFTPTELNQKTRRIEIVEVRQVGAVWSVLSGLNLVETSKMFNQAHCTVLHSIDHVLNTITYPKQYRKQYELLLNVCRISNNVSDLSADGHVNMQKMMDFFVQPLLTLENQNQKVVANIINNRIKQTKIAV